MAKPSSARVAQARERIIDRLKEKSGGAQFSFWELLEQGVASDAMHGAVMREVIRERDSLSDKEEIRVMAQLYTAMYEAMKGGKREAELQDS